MNASVVRRRSQTRKKKGHSPGPSRPPRAGDGALFFLPSPRFPLAKALASSSDGGVRWDRGTPRQLECALKSDLQAFPKKPLCPVRPAPLPHAPSASRRPEALLLLSLLSGFPEPGQGVHGRGAGPGRKAEESERRFFGRNSELPPPWETTPLPPPRPKAAGPGARSPRSARAAAPSCPLPVPRSSGAARRPPRPPRLPRGAGTCPPGPPPPCPARPPAFPPGRHFI